jgi:ABC-type Fe3+-siderophore transport system permease subunit
LHDLAEVLGGLLKIISVALAGAIAGGFSMLTLVLSKEKAISKFRQAWIDSLRTESSAFIAHAVLVAAHITMFEPHRLSIDREDDKAALMEFFAQNHDDYIALNQLSKSIQLRLNPDDAEPETKAVLHALAALDELWDTPSDPRFGAEVDKVTDVLANNVQPLLKKEWERVKAGEKTFRRTEKWVIRLWRICAAIIVGLILIGIGFMLGDGYALLTAAGH